LGLCPVAVFTKTIHHHNNKGTVTRGLRKYQEEIPGKHSTDSLKKKNCHPGNIAHTKESTTVRSLKPEWWGAPLVQGKEHRENPLLRNDNNSIQFNSLFIYVLSSTAGGQLQSQHGKQIQQTEKNTHKENKTRKK
jgi:hypothetical protein